MKSVRNKVKPTQKKIEIDKKTAEPKIVDSKILPEQLDYETDKNVEEIIRKVNNSTPKYVGKQLVMTHLGLNKGSNDTDKKQKILRKSISLLFIVFVVGVLVYTAYDDFSSADLISWDHLFSIFESTWFYILFVILSFLLFFFLRGLQRSIFCRSITKKWCLKTCICASITCQFYNDITPLSAGGQPFEIHFFSQNGLHGGHASAVPLSAYVISMFSSVTIGVIAIILYKNNTLQYDVSLSFIPDTIYIMSIVGLSLNFFMPILVILFSLSPRICAKIIGFFIGFGAKIKIVKDKDLTITKTLKTLYTNSVCIKKSFKSPLVLITTFILGICEQLAICSIAYFTLRFFGFDWVASGFFEWMQVIVICIVINNAVCFIPTPGSSGAADLSIYAFFSAVLESGLAFPAMLTWRMFNYYFMIIFGFIMLKIIASKRKKETTIND